MGVQLREIASWAWNRKFIATVLVMVTLSIGILIGTVISGHVNATHAPVSSGATPLELPNPVSMSNSFAAIVSRDEPAVVNISTTQVIDRKQQPQGPRGRGQDPFQDFFNRFFDSPDQSPEAERSLGSGMIVDKKGFILTNNHVIEQATKIQVQLNGDPTLYTAKLVGADEETDLAVIKIDLNRALPILRLGNSDGVQVGDWVLAIGSPFGLQATVTAGIVSAKDRGNVGRQFQHFLQTDAAINPGNSGGPLINLRGELIGLNVAMYREGQGIGFAIPIRQVTEALSEIFIPEVLHALSFGARIKSGPYPLLVTTVEPNRPADKAGLKVGDQILQVDGKTPKGFIECSELLNVSHRPTTLLVARKGSEPRKLTVSLTPLAMVIKEKLGIDLKELTPELVRALGVKSKVGLLIADVEKGGPAEPAQLQSGFLITSINAQTTTDLMSAVEILAARKKDERVRLTVLVPQRAGKLVGYRQGSVDVKLR